MENARMRQRSLDLQSVYPQVVPSKMATRWYKSVFVVVVVVVVAVVVVVVVVVFYYFNGGGYICCFIPFWGGPFEESRYPGTCLAFHVACFGLIRGRHFWSLLGCTGLNQSQYRF